MATEWFCEISGKQLGPLLPKQLRAMVDQGKLAPEDRVRQGAEGVWVPAGRVKGLFPDKKATSTGALPAKQAPKSRAVKPAAEPRKTAKPVSKTAAAGAANMPVALPVAQAEQVPVAQAQAVANPPQPPPVAQAQPVTTTPTSTDSSAGGFPFVANETTPTARSTGRSGVHAAPRKRGNKRNVAVVVILALLVMGLAAAAVALWALSDDKGGSTGDQVAATKGDPAKPAGKPEDLDNLESKPAGTAAPDAATTAVAVGPVPDESKYIDASKLPDSCGPVSVRIVSAEQGVPRVRGRRVVGAGDPPVSLVLSLVLKNNNADLMLDYTSWRTVASRSVRLRDEKGREYRVADLSRATPEGGARGQVSIYPDAPVKDVLVFQRPMPGIESLYLDLPVTVFQPREKFAGEESFHLRIPASMIGTIAEPVQPETPVLTDPVGLGPPPDGVSGPPAGDRPEDNPFEEVDEPAEERPQPPREERQPPPMSEFDQDDAPSIFDDEPDLRGEDNPNRPARGFEGEFDGKFGPGGPPNRRGGMRGQHGPRGGQPGMSMPGMHGMRGPGMGPGGPRS